MKVMLLMPLLAACATIPKAAYVRGPNEPEPRVIVHTPTATVPYQWTEELLPPSYESPQVFINGIPQ